MEQTPNSPGKFKWAGPCRINGGQKKSILGYNHLHRARYSMSSIPYSRHFMSFALLSQDVHQAISLSIAPQKTSFISSVIRQRMFKSDLIHIHAILLCQRATMASAESLALATQKSTHNPQKAFWIIQLYRYKLDRTIVCSDG